eukprot:TRINITY_DN59889_c0_g1_i1.p1 TRINITY_DN59889_c0_g1~~TRINITY_DN59889_c0_g1_i1.p1  ORF type:complete len:540 (-),score=131.80 TRINITY_DN59889_c0_g1_i1:94-1713(-)
MARGRAPSAAFVACMSCVLFSFIACQAVARHADAATEAAYRDLEAAAGLAAGSRLMRRQVRAEGSLESDSGEGDAADVAGGEAGLEGSHGFLQFADLDLNHDGVITRSELVQTFQPAFKGGGMTTQASAESQLDVKDEAAFLERLGKLEEMVDYLRNGGPREPPGGAGRGGRKGELTASLDMVQKATESLVEKKAGHHKSIAEQLKSGLGGRGTSRPEAKQPVSLEQLEAPIKGPVLKLPPAFKAASLADDPALVNAVSGSGINSAMPSWPPQAPTVQAAPVGSPVASAAVAAPTSVTPAVAAVVNPPVPPATQVVAAAVPSVANYANAASNTAAVNPPPAVAAVSPAAATVAPVVVPVANSASAVSNAAPAMPSATVQPALVAPASTPPVAAAPVQGATPQTPQWILSLAGQNEASHSNTAEVDRSTHVANESSAILRRLEALEADMKALKKMAEEDKDDTDSEEKANSRDSKAKKQDPASVNATAATTAATDAANASGNASAAGAAKSGASWQATTHCSLLLAAILAGGSLAALLLG